MSDLLFIISRLFGKKFIEGIRLKLVYAGISQKAEIWFGTTVLLTFFLSLFAFVVTYFLASSDRELISVLAFFSVCFALVLINYIDLFFRITNRARKVEIILPDFLLLIGSNLRAGMTPYHAFVSASRPEFSPLYEEVKRFSNTVGAQTSLEDALLLLSSHFDSSILRKTINLFSKGAKAGGHLAQLLFANAEEIRKIQDLRQELISSTRSYAIFLGFIVVIVMPFLLSVSVHFLTVFTTIQGNLGIDPSDPSLGGVVMFTGKLGITPEDMKQVAYVALGITAFFSSILIGVINVGKPLYGLKYFPLLLIPGLVFFLMAQAMVASVAPF